MTSTFTSHGNDTTEQINRIEEMFAAIGAEREARGNPITEGLIAEKTSS